MTSVQVSLKRNGKIIFSNLRDKTKKNEPKFQNGQLVRSADFKKTISERDSTNLS